MSVSVILLPNFSGNTRASPAAVGGKSSSIGIKCPKITRRSPCCSMGRMIRTCKDSVQEDDNDNVDYDSMEDEPRRLYYEKMLRMHQIIVHRKQQVDDLTIVPFAKRCQDKYNKLGGYPIRFQGGGWQYEYY